MYYTHPGGFNIIYVEVLTFLNLKFPQNEGKLENVIISSIYMYIYTVMR